MRYRPYLDEIVGSDSIGGFFSGQLLELFLRFTVESLQNTVGALIWPVRVIAYSPPRGFVILAAMYLLFTYVLKRPLERWLFHEERPADPDQLVATTDKEAEK